LLDTYAEIADKTLKNKPVEIYNEANHSSSQHPNTSTQIFAKIVQMRAISSLLEYCRVQPIFCKDKEINYILSEKADKV